MAAVWICLCAFLNCLGWLLSALHMLNRTGYLVAFALAGIAVWFWHKRANPKLFSAIAPRKLKSRFRRGFPRAFLILAALAILGGVLYPPSNYDALAYRVPRMLHWLTAEQWHWIHTDFYRVNVRACGVEWVTTPLIALAGTDRLAFLPNVASLLVLPGLVFSVLWRMGAKRRVAYCFMWIVPTGYVYLSQIATIGNDVFCAVFPLVALDFALRGRKSGNYADAALGLLAAALMTGAKATIIPLVLPWGLVYLPNIKRLIARPVATALLALVCVFSSILPISYLNDKYSGDWTGTKAEKLDPNWTPTPQFMWQASVILASQNLSPPVMPDPTLEKQAIKFVMRMPPFGGGEEILPVIISEIHQDGDGGAGVGVWSLLFVGWMATKFSKAGRVRSQTLPRWIWWGFISGLAVASLVFISKMTQPTIGSASRLFTPYYGFIIAIIAVYIHDQAVRGRWFRVMAYLTFIVAAGLTILSPGHPLWPVKTFLARFEDSDSRFIKRMDTVYSAYRVRHDAFRPLLELLPADAKVVGMDQVDQLETSVWRPFGSRRVFHVTNADTAETVKERGIQYLLIGDPHLQAIGITSAEWAHKMGGTVIASKELLLRAASGHVVWHIVKVNNG